MNETDLIRGCVAKDPVCQHALFATYSGLLMTICRRYSADGHEAEDMLQEAFISIFNNIFQFRFSGSFEGWLRRITVNTAIALIQKRKVRIYEISEKDNETISPDFNIDSSLDAEYLLKLINELPEGYRLVFNLYAFEGYSHEEIAAMLKIKPATSRSQLSKARSLLKERICFIQKITG